MKKILLLAIILLVIGGAGYGAYLLTRPSVPFRPSADNTLPANLPETRTLVSVNLVMADGKAYLTDSNGMTLYYFAKDSPSASNCPAGPCLDLWPAFWGETMSVESPLLAADFSVITRPDGAKQTAYKGWPLYYFANDKKAGDRLGQGSLGVWFIVPSPFYTIVFRSHAVVNGTYLADAAGRALYAFSGDTMGTAIGPAISACVDACVSSWPPFFMDKIILPASMSVNDITVIMRPDGVKQIAYKGRPLYYHSEDLGPDEVKGQGIDGAWSAAMP